MQLPDEPLTLSAPLARRLAETLCVDGCAWHHGLWQYLRIMGMATGPGHFAAFYREAFAKVRSHSGAPRMLISGTADYSMLAHVLAAFRSRGAEPEITVIDLCETPLALNRWYAERAGCPIETQRCDVLEYMPAQAFDAVCTDSFLGQFSPASRPALIAQWRQLLRPGGMLITVKRLRPDSDGKQMGFTDDQARAFVARVRDVAETMHSLLRIDTEDLLGAAEIYALNQHSWPVRSQDEVIALLEQGGFRVDTLALSKLSTPGNMSTGPTIPGNAPYLQVIASRL